MVIMVKGMMMVTKRGLVSILVVSDIPVRRVCLCHCVIENHAVMMQLRHALNDTSLARRMTQESWSQDVPPGSKFALGLLLLASPHPR